MQANTALAAGCILALVYFLVARPIKALGKLKRTAIAEDGTSIALKESTKSAPMPMVKYRNRLFPRLYIYQDRIEYHILKNELLRFEDMDSIALGNRSMFRYILTVVSGGENSTTTTFAMKADTAEQCLQLLQARCDIKDLRVPWS